MLVDQPADDAPSLDPGGEIDGAAGMALRGLLLQSLVRPMAALMPGVVGQDATEVPLAEDQHVIQALATWATPA